MRASAALAVLLLAPAVRAQTVKPASPPTPEVAARRFARALELPASRREAVAGLLLIGAPAVPALLDAARHPDLDVARTAFQVIAALEHDGLAAVPALETTAKGDDARAQAAAWTLARLPRRGTFLVPSMEEGVVREFDDTGKQIWKSEAVGQPWQAQILANGNLLVAAISGNVREIDAKGTAVFEFKANHPYTADRLIDGNTLVAAWGNQTILEVDAKGTEVWSQAGVPALHATRLPDGATLVGDYNRGTVRELARDGTARWQIEGAQNPYAVHRLRDGSTLVLEQQPAKAKVFGADGKVLRAYEVTQQASDVVLLPDGWIECGNRYVRRCDAQGKERWRADIGGWAGRITLR